MSNIRPLANTRAHQKSRHRISILFTAVAALLFVVAVVVARLQTVQRGQYERMSQENAIRRIYLPAVRADIVDRSGGMLAYDAPKYRFIHVDHDGLWEQHSLEMRDVAKIEERGLQPGSYIQVVPQRVYPQGATASNFIGYLGQIDDAELARLRGYGYHQGDRVGKAGIEQFYERRVNGERGERQLAVNSKGKFLFTSKEKRSAGRPKLRLTIDMELQHAAMRAMEGRKGAAIFMDPYTGEILALVTMPTFDNNIGSGGFSTKEWNDLHHDPGKPLLNRAISSLVPPGSVFKLAVTAALLESGLVKPTDKVRCPGYFRFGTRTFKCWTSAGHGTVDLNKAIAQSCDVYFYTMGHRIGVERIKKYSRMLGLGSKAGIDIPGESIGVIPDDQWKRGFRGVPWYPGDTISVSIGQGYVQVTPIQILRMAAVYANGGSLVTPHFSAEGKWPTSKATIKPSTIKQVRSGMRSAVLSGTCARLRSLPFTSAGKTGTAEDPPRPAPHAWFVGFAPYEHPKIVGVVFIENGGHGSSAALPVAQKVFEKALDLWYFDRSGNAKPGVGRNKPAAMDTEAVRIRRQRELR